MDRTSNIEVMKRSRNIIVATAVVMVLAVWLAIDVHQSHLVIPPPGVTDIDSFLNWQPSGGDMEIVQGPGGEHLLALGAPAGFMPSGPPGYVFDRKGRLVDWSSDIGDDTRFQNAWTQPRPSRQLKRSEVRAWLGAH